MKRLSLSRLERKLALVVAAVSIVPVVVALVLGRSSLHEAFRAGINDEIRSELEQGVASQRARLQLLRQQAELMTDRLADDYVVRSAIADDSQDSQVRSRVRELCGRDSTIVGVRISTPSRTIDIHLHSVPSTQESLLLSRSTSFGELLVEVKPPTEVASAFQSSGEALELFRRVEAKSELLTTTLFYVFLALVSVATLLALGIALWIARRVTVRIGELVRGVERFGQGTLNAPIPIRGSDEVSELTTAFNQMVHNLNESRERIAYLQKVEAWQGFAQRLAHEIKNPLTPIQLAAQEMSRSYQGEDEVFRRKLSVATEIIEEEVHSLRRLVGAFSSFARLPSAELSKVNLSDTFREVERGLPGLLSDAQVSPDLVKITVAMPNESVCVRADAVLLRRAVDNLVRNAVEALPTSGGVVRLSLSTTTDRCCIVIEDSGPGVTAEMHERIFEPYFTTKGQGSGLGLAIVKKIVLEHEGELTCAISPLGGARFEIRLGTTPC